MKKPGLFFIVAAILFASCSGKSRASSAFDENNEATVDSVDNTFTYETFTNSKKFAYKTEGANGPFTCDGSTSVKFDYPTGNTLPDIFISDWLKKEMKEMGFSYIPTEFDSQSVSKLNQSFGKTVNDLIHDGCFQATLEFKSLCSLVTDKVVSYQLHYSILVSPGSPGIYALSEKGVTYDIANRKALTWDIVPVANRTKFDQLVSKLILAKGEYYTSLSDLKEHYYENSHLVPSEAQPIFTEDGILWMQSGGYFKAEINVVIPYDDLRGIVTPEAAALFPPKSQKALLMEQRKAMIPALIKKLYTGPNYHEAREKSLSKEFSRISDKVGELDEEVWERGEASPFQVNPWDGYDEIPFPTSYTTGTIRMDNPDKASVDIIISYKNSEQVKESHICSTLELIWEDNTWKVNDVGGMLEDYKEYLRDNGKSF